MFLISSLLSLIPTLQGYFYCICLLYIIEESDILNRVLQAVTKNGVLCVVVVMPSYCVIRRYCIPGNTNLCIKGLVYINSVLVYSAYITLKRSGCYRNFLVVGWSTWCRCALHLCCGFICLSARVILCHQC